MEHDIATSPSSVCHIIYQFVSSVFFGCRNQNYLCGGLGLELGLRLVVGLIISGTISV